MVQGSRPGSRILELPGVPWGISLCVLFVVYKPKGLSNIGFSSDVYLGSTSTGLVALGL